MTCFFTWFIRLGVDDLVWDPTTFTKNYEGLLAGDAAWKFMAALMAQPKAILNHALANPCHGATLVEQERWLRGLQVSLGRVRGVWMRHYLLTKHERPLRLENATAERKITLTEEQTRVLERFSPEFHERHIEAPHTGALVAIDAFREFFEGKSNLSNTVFR